MFGITVVLLCHLLSADGSPIRGTEDLLGELPLPVVPSAPSSLTQPQLTPLFPDAAHRGFGSRCREEVISLILDKHTQLQLSVQGNEIWVNAPEGQNTLAGVVSVPGALSGEFKKIQQEFLEMRLAASENPMNVLDRLNSTLTSLDFYAVFEKQKAKMKTYHRELLSKVEKAFTPEEQHIGRQALRSNFSEQHSLLAEHFADLPPLPSIFRQTTQSALSAALPPIESPALSTWKPDSSYAQRIRRLREQFRALGLPALEDNKALAQLIVFIRLLRRQRTLGPQRLDRSIKVFLEKHHLETSGPRLASEMAAAISATHPLLRRVRKRKTKKLERLIEVFDARTRLESRIRLREGIQPLPSSESEKLHKASEQFVAQLGEHSDIDADRLTNFIERVHSHLNGYPAASHDLKTCPLVLLSTLSSEPARDEA